MESAIYICPGPWRDLLPPGVRPLTQPREIGKRPWAALALTPQALPLPGEIRCGTLLLPGEWGPPAGVRAERVVTYGLSPRDSLTLSSLRQPVLCVQRALPRPDGTVVEPQEIPLTGLPLPAAELLPLLGLRLLQMPWGQVGKSW